MKGRIANAPKSSKSCGHHLHRIPALCKKSRVLVNKNWARQNRKRRSPWSRSAFFFEGLDEAANVVDIRTIKGSHFFLLSFFSREQCGQNSWKGSEATVFERNFAPEFPENEGGRWQHLQPSPKISGRKGSRGMFSTKIQVLMEFSVFSLRPM